MYITYVIVLQAEDRATEANKTCSRLQKDVDRIEGLLVNKIIIIMVYLLSSLSAVATRVSLFARQCMYGRPVIDSGTLWQTCRNVTITWGSCSR